MSETFNTTFTTDDSADGIQSTNVSHSVEGTISTNALDRDTSSILSTATTSYGSPVTGPVTDDCQVTVNGMTTTAKVAASLGYLSRNPDGSYSDTEANDQPESGDKEIQQETKVEPKAPTLGAEGSQAISGLAQTYHESELMSLASAVITGNEGGLIENMANSGGMEAVQLQEAVDTVYDSYYDMAFDHVSQYDVDPDALFDFMEDGYGDKRVGALTKLVHGDLSGFDEAVDAYKNSDGYVDALLKHHKLDHSEPLDIEGGGQVTASEAIRRGIVTYQTEV